MSEGQARMGRGAKSAELIGNETEPIFVECIARDGRAGFQPLSYHWNYHLREGDSPKCGGWCDMTRASTRAFDPQKKAY